MYSESDADNPQYNFIDAQAGYRVNSDDQPQLASFSGPDPFQNLNLNPDVDYATRYRYFPSQTQPEQYPSGDSGFGEGPSTSSHVDPSPYPNVLDTRRGDYTIVTDAGNDEPLIFSNASSLQLTPFDPYTSTMFPDPNIDARTNYYDNHSDVGNSAAVRVESAPSATPYAASTLSHHHAFIASHFPDFYAPFQSADGVSSMPDSEDVMPLHAGQPLPLDEPLCFDAPSLGNPSPAEEPSESRPSRKRHQGDPFIAFEDARASGEARAELNRGVEALSDGHAAAWYPDFL